jgi:hypothetical protein
VCLGFARGKRETVRTWMHSQRKTKTDAAVCGTLGKLFLKAAQCVLTLSISAPVDFFDYVGYVGSCHTHNYDFFYPLGSVSC